MGSWLGADQGLPPGSLTGTPGNDADDDGLSDCDESLYGTDPLDPDSDDDGLLDGTEVDMAQGTGCPNPLTFDSDGDGLGDGAEVDNGTSPCLYDTDGDGLNDRIDPFPLQSATTCSQLEAHTRQVAVAMESMNLDLFIAPNHNARIGRRSSMATRIHNAANALRTCKTASAKALLTSVLKELDGDEPPVDWIKDSPERQAMEDVIAAFISLLGS